MAHDLNKIVLVSLDDCLINKHGDQGWYFKRDMLDRLMLFLKYGYEVSITHNNHSVSDGVIKPMQALSFIHDVAKNFEVYANTFGYTPVRRGVPPFKIAMSKQSRFYKGAGSDIDAYKAYYNYDPAQLIVIGDTKMSDDILFANRLNARCYISAYSLVSADLKELESVIELVSKGDDNIKLTTFTKNIFNYKTEIKDGKKN